MIIKNPQFELSVMNKSQYPTNNIPEVILVGKSNVGKSSFINSLIGRKSLARTSSEPGKTRQLNFYNIDNIFYFVDLPGYGYSKMSKDEQAKVSEAIEEYLFSRKQISLIIFLIDIRHKPNDNDKIMFDYIKNSNKRFIIIASKSDKVAKTKVCDYSKLIANELNISSDMIIPFSTVNKLNKEIIWNKIEENIF